MRDSQRPAAEFNETAMRLWKAHAFAMVHHLATNHDAFTTDELWVLLADLPKPPEPRALGAVIRQAQDEKIIAKSAMVVTSAHKTNHMRPVAVWLSILRNARLEDAFEYVARRSRTLAIPLFAATADANEAITR